MSDAHASHDEKAPPRFFNNAVAVVVFIMIMAVVIWGLLHIASLSTSWFASTFSSPRSDTARSTAMPTPVPSIVQSVQPTPTSVGYTSPAEVYRGPADLAVRILSVDSSSPASVTFDIANVGGSASGSYTFTAYLPTAQTYVYASPVQYSLNAGDHVVSTLHFSQGTSGTVTIIVHAADANATNNTVSQNFVSAYQYNYPQYQYPYDPNVNSYYQYDYSQPQYHYQQYDYYGHPYGGYDYQYTY